MGSEVTFTRTPQTSVTNNAGAAHAPVSVASRPAPSLAHADGTPTVLLVTCVKGKLATPAAARDLYVSTLFTKEREYAERLGVPWFILSAKHGLVAPDEWLAPYERYLPDTPTSYRAAWGTWTAERLELLVGSLKGKLVEIHAGAAYLAAVAGPLESKGARVLAPLEGLSMGGRLQWYGQHSAAAAGQLAGQTHSDEHTAAAAFSRMLRDEVNALSPREFLDRRGAGLQEPGLYSWWVDPAGAEDLAHGLGLRVSAGLIYAGLAGATRWPSGRHSTNTLWSRIAGMHLTGPHEFSTFRRTLAAILAHGAASGEVDESAVTEWMMQHLRVLPVPYDDADSLGRLEEDVLQALDPAFNLQGMAASPVRLRIKALRRALRT